MKPMTEYSDEQLKVFSQEYTLRGKAAATEIERRAKRKTSSKEEPKAMPKADTEKASSEEPNGEANGSPQKPKRPTRRRKTAQKQGE